MEDNRDKLIPAQLAGWTWDLNGYTAKVPFYNADDLTKREVQSVFQLDPEPPVLENMNDYIIEAVHSRDLRCFAFFLHHYENRLNGRVRRFLLREGLDRYDPERFFGLQNGLCACHAGLSPGIRSRTRSRFSDLCPSFYRERPLTCRMQEEAGSFENVDEVQGCAWNCMALQSIWPV